MNHDRTPTILIRLTGALALVACPSMAAAQDTGGGDTGGGASPNVTVVQVPAPASAPAAPAWNPDSHLPSSARSSTDASRAQDTFDFATSGGSTGPVHGSSTGTYVVDGSYVPEAHSVRRGDTLWDISQRYFQNAYFWPRVWSLNPQVQNPHWIYPGDRIRLRESGGAQRGSAFNLRHATVPPQTIFLREVGFVDDPTKDTWGEIVGSPNDHMLLTETRDIYVQLDGDHDVQLGQELTIFMPLKVDVKDAAGQLVSIRGTARVDRYNPKTHMVRARVTEAIDTVERGAKVGPVGRRFEVVPPKQADQDLDARIATALFPNQFWGQNQVVFVNKGSEDGVKAGNRFFAVERVDRWVRDHRRAGNMARLRPRLEDDRPARVDPIEVNADQELFPDETYAELRVIRTREHTSMCLITASIHEIERDATLVMRKGF
jgi:hypothetical protein